MYTEAHEKIRENPDGEPAEQKDITHSRKETDEPAKAAFAVSLMDLSMSALSA